MIVVSELCSGLFSDVMDKMGYKNQIILNMKCNHNGISFLGRARTILIEDVETEDENIRKGLSFLSELKSGEILLVKGSQRFAYFGELMTRLSTNIGIGGVVIDGLTRDTKYTHRRDVNLPILAKGYSPIDIKGRGRVVETDVTIVIDGIEVKPDDLIYADNEGVCIIPKEIELEVMKKVEEKLIEEKYITELLDKNITVEELLKEVREF